MSYRSVLIDMGLDIEKCREWLRAIKPVFKKSERAYANYRKRLLELGVALKANLSRPRAARVVEDLAFACEEFLKVQKNSIVDVLAIGETEEKLTVASKEDFDELTKDVKHAIDRATIFQIYQYLRDAYVEIKKLMQLAQHISVLISSELGRMHEIVKAARALQEEDIEEAKAEKLIGHINAHWTGKHPGVVESIKKQLKPMGDVLESLPIAPLAKKRILEELEEHKKKVHELLEISINRFRYALEVSEEVAEEDVEESDKISRVSVIEQSLLNAWKELRKTS